MQTPDDSNEASTKSLQKGEHADASLLFTTVGAVIFTTRRSVAWVRGPGSVARRRGRKGRLGRESRVFERAEVATGEQGHGRGPRGGGGNATKTPVNVPYLLACSDTEDKGRGDKRDEGGERKRERGRRVGPSRHRQRFTLRYDATRLLRNLIRERMSNFGNSFFPLVLFPSFTARGLRRSVSTSNFYV